MHDPVPAGVLYLCNHHILACNCYMINEKLDSLDENLQLRKYIERLNVPVA